MSRIAAIFLCVLSIRAGSLGAQAQAPAAAKPVAAPPPSIPAAAVNPAPEPECAPVAAFTPPKTPDPERYRKLSDPSPFTVRLSVNTDSDEDPFPDLVLIGYMVLGGKMNAWVQMAEQEEPIQLVEGERDPGSHLMLVAVHGAEDMFTAQVEIEASGKKGNLRFTDAGISVAPSAAAAKAQVKKATTAQASGTPSPGAPARANPTPAPPTGLQPQTHSPSGSNPAPNTTPRRRIILPN